MGSRGPIIELSRALREHSTDAESVLWYCVRDRRLFGAKFRRQHTIGPFIADFACPARKLVIELDGGGHNTPEIIERDRQRSEWLERNRWKVIRFWNHEVLHELEAVLMRITEFL